MRPVHEHCRTPADCSAPLHPIDDLFVKLLHIHEHAAACGLPLLTKFGIAYLAGLLLSAGKPEPWESVSEPHQIDVHTGYVVPVWDADNRQLWFKGKVVKQFRQPAPNQTRLLDVFEEQGWASQRIDDPLPLARGEHDHDAKKRLHNTLKNLNRGLPPGTIRFRGDGTGQAVIWEYASE